MLIFVYQITSNAFTNESHLVLYGGVEHRALISWSRYIKSSATPHTPYGGRTVIFLYFLKKITDNSKIVEACKHFNKNKCSYIKMNIVRINDGTPDMMRFLLFNKKLLSSCKKLLSSSTDNN